MKLNYSKKSTRGNEILCEENVAVELSLAEMLSLTDKAVEIIKDESFIKAIKNIIKDESQEKVEPSDFVKITLGKAFEM